MIKLFSHNHKWQIRGQNSFGLPTYRICLKCRETQERLDRDNWVKCYPMHSLDILFDEKDDFIFPKG